ncbi:MAG TPA: CHAP domain-containing protein [Acidimicrobiales bacterium]|nr:CHAP domain-containing protein [Acidimicrobiales bacterium]
MGAELKKRRSWKSAMLAGAVLGSALAVAVQDQPADAVGTAWGGSGVSAYGDAPDVGGFSGLTVPAPLVAMAASSQGNGYWVGAADGSVYSFGEVPFLGSLSGRGLYAPIVGMAATADGRGYWMVASDGGVFAFGDAGFYGSLGAIKLAQPITAMAAAPDGKGYWLIGADGGVFAFGDAQFHGSAANDNLGAPVVSVASTADGGGYWMVAATGGVVTFGDATQYGPEPNDPPFSPVATMAVTPDRKGYWLLRPDEVQTTFTDPAPTSALGQDIVRRAESQVGPDPDYGAGAYCNPYGPCESWCALFATWVWEQEGIAIPRYSFVGSVYNWAAPRGLALPGDARPAPGDFVLYGTGPQNTSTSSHMGIVAQVWPDGAVDTVEGDAGPEPAGDYGVIMNGPFLPAFSKGYNGFGVYSWVEP